MRVCSVDYKTFNYMEEQRGKILIADLPRTKKIYLNFGRRELVIRHLILYILIYFSAAKENVKEMATKNKTDSDDDSVKGNVFTYSYIFKVYIYIYPAKSILFS